MQNFFKKYEAMIRGLCLISTKQRGSINTEYYRNNLIRIMPLKYIFIVSFFALLYSINMQDGILNKVRSRRYLSKVYKVTIILIHNESLTETVISKHFSVRLHFKNPMCDELEQNLINFLSKFTAHYESLEQIFLLT